MSKSSQSLLWTSYDPRFVKSWCCIMGTLLRGKAIIDKVWFLFTSEQMNTLFWSTLFTVYDENIILDFLSAKSYWIAHRLSDEIVYRMKLPSQHFCVGSFPPPDLMIGIEIHALASSWVAGIQHNSGLPISGHLAPRIFINDDATLKIRSLHGSQIFLEVLAVLIWREIQNLYYTRNKYYRIQNSQT